MIRVVTVADTNFLTQVHRLRQSLETSGNKYELTIFCDDGRAFSQLQSLNCKVVELEVISALGAKRAKATAYRISIENGSFLYLDADAIVLDSLEELCHGDTITGAPDDLSHCPFIEDRRRPWPNAPELENNVYINSGVFFAPAQKSSFFKQLEEWFLADETWFRYIHSTALFDNHVFCAALNITGEPVRLVDNRVYDWQGLIFQNQVQVSRHGDALVNRATGEKLKIAIFAGYPQSWETLLSLPLDVLSLLMERVQRDPLDRDSAFASLAASFGPSIACSTNSRAPEVTGRLFHELRHVVEGRLGRSTMEGAWFSDPQALIALAFEPQASNATYNGLRTGGAYLDGEEYGALRSFVQTYKVENVLETGAGESTHFFSMLGAVCVSIETDEGPWLDRAREAGAKTYKVSWQESEMQYDQAELEAALLSAHHHSFDLLFVDGPIGTNRRRGVVRQVIGLVKPRYIAYHDAYRDAQNIFRDQAAFGLRLIHFVESARGLAFFTTGRRLVQRPQSRNRWISDLATVDLSATSIRLPDGTLGPRSMSRSALSKVRVEVANNNARSILNSDGVHGLFLSYHWLDHRRKVVVWEGIRTALPFPLMPGDRCECDLEVLAVDTPGEYVLDLTCVQEGIAWKSEGSERIIVAVD